MAAERLHVMAASVRTAYAQGEEDEALLPRVLVDAAGRPVGRIGHGHEVIFYDLRGEREVELTQAFVDPEFRAFDTAGRRARFTTMIEYHPSLPVAVAFPPSGPLQGTLGERLAAAGKTVVKVVESEKAIHLAYFLNGKREAPFPGERRVVVESDRELANYNEKPQMAASEVADRVLEELKGRADVIIVNFANIDVVGHLEDAAAVVAAVETVDRELGRVVAAARNAGVTALVTADHGTVEKWLYPDGKVDTGHTDSPVPFIICEDRLQGWTLQAGDITDVAPTLLNLLGIEPPPQMTGRSLLTTLPDNFRAARAMLVICDGWGQREEEYGNMIKKARTPVMDELRKRYPSTILAAAGDAVGMPRGKVGNSEAGHLHIGAGQRILSDRLRIDEAIAAGDFQTNPALRGAFARARSYNVPLHLLGIVSFYSSHGSLHHLYELLKMAKAQGAPEVYHHALLGRRGERPEAGARYLDEVEGFCEQLGVGRVVTVMGRFWALDREQNWDRVERAYRALAEGKGIECRSENAASKR
jgi:2,3-bisphosphoglycerate-independent phosphoglycerate mutase